MSFIVIGIDPGIHGAIAGIDDEQKLVGVFDMPVMPGIGSRQQVNGVELAKTIIRFGLFDGVSVRIEEVTSMPQDGSVQSFSFGKSVGIVIGVVNALMIPVSFVKPQEWKKQAGLLKKDKDASRTLAQQLYPDASLARKMDDGRAEAILIARFGGG